MKGKVKPKAKRPSKKREQKVDDFWNNGIEKGKVGRPRKFETPNDLWEAACKYFEYQSKRTTKKMDFKGGFAKKVMIETQVPFSIMSLCIYLGVNTKYLSDLKQSLPEMEKSVADEFSEVITRIEGIIFNQQYEGATTGLYQQNIIARALGLVDKKELEVKEQPLFPDVNVPKDNSNK